MTAQEELARRIERDSICRAVQKKIDEGRADFTDTARYTDRAAELLGEVLAAYVPDMPTDERETLCKALLRQRYLDTNAMLNAVQRTLDAAQGLHLAPQNADYPEERVEQAAHSLADETVPMETIVRRAKSAPATIARSFHDDYIEKNAAFRDSAGLKCYITRNAAAKCCEWCTKMAGRYRYGEEPEDVYRRHDNCSCTVTYENGRKRQDVWSKRTWEVPGIGAGAEKPTVFSSGQAQYLQDEKGLTILGQRDIMNLNDSIELFTGADKIDDEQQKTLDQALAPIPEKLLTQLSEYVSEITIDNDRGYSSYNRENHSIILDRKKAAKDIIHELGHAFGDMLNLYEDPEFLRIIANGLDLQDWKGIEPKKHPARGTPVYFYTGVGAKKFLSPYQRRIYVRQDDVGKGNIDPALFREYISVGFDYYFKNPNGLKRSDPDLYHYLEVLINGFTGSSNEGQN